MCNKKTPPTQLESRSRPVKSPEHLRSARVTRFRVDLVDGVFGAAVANEVARLRGVLALSVFGGSATAAAEAAAARDLRGVLAVTVAGVGVSGM